MIRGDLYNENVVTENMSHNFSDIVKNLTGKVVIIFLQTASFPLNTKSRLNENGYISVNKWNNLKGINSSCLKMDR